VFELANRYTEALKSIGVILRTPSPSPEPEPDAEDKDPETMTAEEFREELREEFREELRRMRVRPSLLNFPFGTNKWTGQGARGYQGQARAPGGTWG
jgi:hypothetical protein